MIRLTTTLALLAAIALSGCNLEGVTAAEAGKETKPTQAAAEPAPTNPVLPEPTLPTPVEPEEKLSVQLAWDIPMQRENGDELKPNEIGGYKIEYRRVGTTIFQTFMVEDGLSDSTEIGDLVQGMYEFRIAAFDADGLFSDYSDIATIQVDANS